MRPFSLSIHSGQLILHNSLSSPFPLINRPFSRFQSTFHTILPPIFIHFVASFVSDKGRTNLSKWRPVFREGEREGGDDPFVVSITPLFLHFILSSSSSLLPFRMKSIVNAVSSSGNNQIHSLPLINFLD